MKLEFIRKPIIALIIRDLFSDKINLDILKESNKIIYKDAVIGDNKINHKIRNNKVSYYDEIYTDKRNESILIKSFEGLFDDTIFRQTLSSMPKPFNDFVYTNTHETQVSSYSKGQHYSWHSDRFESHSRMITMVYYFFETPKKFSGGEICLTDSPAYNSILVDKNAEILKIEPINNMLVLFDSTTSHSVKPTICEDVKYARKSANIWVGMK